MPTMRSLGVLAGGGELGVHLEMRDAVAVVVRILVNPGSACKVVLTRHEGCGFGGVGDLGVGREDVRPAIGEARFTSGVVPVLD